MSKLDELIEKLCPDGVEYKELNEVCKFQNGFAFKSRLFSESGLPILRITNITDGRISDDGYVYFNPDDYNENLNNYIVKPDNIVIAMSGATTGKIGYNYSDQEYYLNQRVGLFLPNKSFLLNRYLYHWLLGQSENILAISSGTGAQPNLSSVKMMKFKIPIPPLPVQEEIVRILDNFTDLVAELQAELQARTKQYEYYRDELLRCDDVKKKTLQEISHGITSGKNKEKLQDGLYPVYGSTGIIAFTNSCVYNHSQILIARVGANAGYVHIAQGEYDVSDNTLIINLKEDVSLRYVYYQLTSMNLNQYAKGGGQPLITAGQMKEIEIPIPSLKKQNEIVVALDKFYAICESIIEGLPAEIEARQKQYEYYRDKLLTFKEAGVKA